MADEVGPDVDPLKISIAPSRVAWRLGLVAGLLVATGLAMQILRLAMHRDYLPGLALVTLDGEYNVPALFSFLLLITASALLAFIALLERQRRTADAGKWAILSAGFLLMALDEAVSVHERLIEPLRVLLGGTHLGIFFFAWVIPAIGLVIVLGVFFLPFLLRLPRRAASAFVLAAGIYLGGALGIELFEGWWREQHGHRNAVYHVLVSLEEGMEMLGVIVFIRALLDYLGAHHFEVRLAFEVAEPAQEPALIDTAGRDHRPGGDRHDALA